MSGQGVLLPTGAIERASLAEEFIEGRASSSGRVEADTLLLMEESNGNGNGNASLSRNHRSKSPGPDSSSTNESKRVLSGVKWSVIGSLFIAGAAVATTTFLYTRAQEHIRFEERFEDDAQQIVSSYNHRIASMLWAGLSLYASFISTENYQSEVKWPNVTLPEFDLQTAGHLQTTAAEAMFWAPVLYTPTQRKAWSTYAIANQKLAGINEAQSNTLHNRTIEDGIYRLDADQKAVDENSSSLTIPIWQASPYKTKRHLRMLDLFSVEQLRSPLSLAMATRIPYLSPFLDDNVASFFSGSESRTAKTIFLFPVMNARAGTQVTGMIVTEIDWVAFFSLVLPRGCPAITVVLKNSCEQQRTFQLKDGTVTFVGEGDIHNENYNHMKWSTNVTSFRRFWNESQRPDAPVTIFPSQDAAIKVAENETRLKELGVCVYFMDIYPTQEYEGEFKTNVPSTYVLIIVAVFFCVCLLFVVYDVLVERRQLQTVESAAMSNALIRSLFPATFRDRLFQNSGRISNRNQTRTGIPTCLASTNSDLGWSHSPKLRLTKFLNASGPMLDSTSNSSFGDEPIAEMFSHTTVVCTKSTF